MTIHIVETQIETLPKDLRDLPMQNMGTKETYLFGVFYKKEEVKTKTRRIPEKHGVVIITDYRLAEFVRGYDWVEGLCEWPEQEAKSETEEATYSRTLALERIKAVQSLRGDVWISYVLHNYDVGQLGVRFENHDGLMRTFCRELTKAAANALVRIRTPAGQASIPDIGDQIMKLAELRKNGAITSDEYEAAKRKLLS